MTAVVAEKGGYAMSLKTRGRGRSCVNGKPMKNRPKKGGNNRSRKRQKGVHPIVRGAKAQSAETTTGGAS